MSNNLCSLLHLIMNNNFLRILLIFLIISRIFLFSFWNPPGPVFLSYVCICLYTADFLSDIAFPLSRIHCRPPLFAAPTFSPGSKTGPGAAAILLQAFLRNEYTWNQLIFFCFCTFIRYICLYIENIQYFYSFIFCIFCILILSDSVYFLLIFIYS